MNFESSNNDFIEVGNIPALDLSGDEVTLSVWIRLESSSMEGKILAKWADAGSKFQYLLSTDSGPTTTTPPRTPGGRSTRTRPSPLPRSPSSLSCPSTGSYACWRTIKNYGTSWRR